MAQQAIQVTWEDQQAINSFSKLNSRLHETNAKITGHKKVIDSLEEANDELMLSDEEVVRYSVGEVLVHVSKDEAEAKLATLTEKLQGELRGYLAEVDEIKGTMKELKVRLYGKFGNAINLEED